jgi:hypothetical protein
MATGIIRIVVGSAVAALALAAPALAKQDAAALEVSSAPSATMAAYYLHYYGSELPMPTASKAYDAAALKAMGARYQAMVDYYLHYYGSGPIPGVPGWDLMSRSSERTAPAVGVGRDVLDGSQPQLHGREAVPATGTDGGFDWRIFGIATGSALLAAALGGAVLLATRTRGRVAHP